MCMVFTLDVVLVQNKANKILTFPTFSGSPIVVSSPGAIIS